MLLNSWAYRHCLRASSDPSVNDVDLLCLLLSSSGSPLAWKFTGSHKKVSPSSLTRLPPPSYVWCLPFQQHRGHLAGIYATAADFPSIEATAFSLALTRREKANEIQMTGTIVQAVSQGQSTNRAGSWWALLPHLISITLRSGDCIFILILQMRTLRPRAVRRLVQSHAGA